MHYCVCDTSPNKEEIKIKKNFKRPLPINVPHPFFLGESDSSLQLVSLVRGSSSGGRDFGFAMFVSLPAPCLLFYPSSFFFNQQTLTGC